MTWLDQLHLDLSRLGYVLPVVDAKVEGHRDHPEKTQTCPDSRYFDSLQTARIGKVGWHSWDFAYEDWSDCDESGYRMVSFHRIKCQHGPGCKFGKEVLPLSDIARDA